MRIASSFPVGRCSIPAAPVREDREIPGEEAGALGELVRYHSLITDSARWEGFAFREGDIVISTPPKCGTTWTQMICALLIFQTPELTLPLDTLSPWIDMVTRARTEVFADLQAQ